MREKATLVMGDLPTGPRYLIAFGSRFSEFGSDRATIDVESGRSNAFSADNQKRLEGYANAALASIVSSFAGSGCAGAKNRKTHACYKMRQGVGGHGEMLSATRWGGRGGKNLVSSHERG